MPSPLFFDRPSGPTFPFPSTTSPTTSNPCLRYSFLDISVVASSHIGRPSFRARFCMSTSSLLACPCRRQSTAVPIMKIYQCSFCSCFVNDFFMNGSEALLYSKSVRFMPPKPTFHNAEMRPADSIVKGFSKSLPGGIRTLQQLKSAISTSIAPLMAAWVNKAENSWGIFVGCSDMG